jgi:hypothetical protein
MCDSSAASPTDPLRQFDAIWHVDFEYREDANHLPVPVSLFAIEQRTGTELFLEREQLLALNRAPFGVGPRDLMVSYASNAELSAFLALSWPLPRNVLDVYVEVIIAINGRTDLWPNKGRPGLLAALSLFDLPTTMTAAEKDRMRDLILGHTTYSDEQRRQIREYNRSDVDATLALLPELLPTINLPRALHYGRFMAAVAGEERTGLPIDVPYHDHLQENWERLRLHYIARDDEFELYDEGQLSEQRLGELIAAMGWDWPRTPTGKYELKRETLGRQAKRYPGLKRFVRLRENIAELSINKLANTIGSDGFSRCPRLPFWTTTGRNQPSAEGKVYLPSLPTCCTGCCGHHRAGRWSGSTGTARRLPSCRGSAATRP